MADISKIKLPDGTTYNILSERVKITPMAGLSDIFCPILVTQYPTVGLPNEIIVPAHGTVPKVNIYDGSIKANMYIEDISDQYTPSKTSGNWSIGSDDGAYRIKAYRMSNLVQIAIAFHGNGSAVSSGSNGFIGDISGGPLPVQQVTLNGFYSSSILAATLDTDGSITVRPFSSSCTLSNSSRAYLTGTFLTNT